MLPILAGSFPFTNISFSAPKPPHPAYPETISTIGDHIRTRGLDSGLLQKEVAECIGVDTNTLINWELNYAAPKIQYLPKIIAFLGYSPVPAGESFPEKLKTYRQVKGLSQLRLAHVLGVNPTTVVKWEAGTSQPKPEMRERVLGVIDDVSRFQSKPQSERVG